MLVYSSRSDSGGLTVGDTGVAALYHDEQHRREPFQHKRVGEPLHTGSATRGCEKLRGSTPPPGERLVCLIARHTHTDTAERRVFRLVRGVGCAKVS